MNIFIVRHGESLATLDRKIFARMNPRKIPLTQWGYEQLVDVGKHIGELHVKTGQKKRLRIYYAPHDRIVQSKDALLQGVSGKYDSTPIISESDLLREREHGSFDGKDSVTQCHVDENAFSAMHSLNPFRRYKTPMPNGESVEQVQKRLQLFLKNIERDVRPDDEDLVIITHGGNCRLLESLLTHQNMIVTDFDNPPPVSSIIHITTPHLHTPGEALSTYISKQRTHSTPTAYKTNAYYTGSERQQPSSEFGLPG